MKESLFRKKNIEKVFSPDQLNDYIKVSNPSTWVILAAVIIFLAAVLIWAVYGQIPGTAEHAVSFILN
ncbi:MAG: hypothetical protein Q4G60_12095 [bacterium]|nr:hypothetical protein [bacterium]